MSTQDNENNVVYLLVTEIKKTRKMEKKVQAIFYGSSALNLIEKSWKWIPLLASKKQCLSQWHEEKHSQLLK